MKNSEIKLSSKIISSLLIVIYFLSSSPVLLVAEDMVNKIEQQKEFYDSLKINSSNKTEANLTEETSEKTITVSEGGIVELNGASVEIPAEALEKDTVISITHLIKVEDTGDSLHNATPFARGYRFLPAGSKFKKEVIVTLPYDPILNYKQQSLEELYTYFFDKEKNQWVKLERLEIDKEKCVVRSVTTHFTDMINATLTLPESASPVDVNLNSIKNLEAAKPDGHLIKFNPPKADNTGDASFSFELDIPGGRAGMQPSVTIFYSSAGGNGIMGKGFDIRYSSSITIDTRFGLPKYNKKDSYMLDGILLKEKETNQQSDYIEYSMLKESAYDRIRRYNPGTENDYWEVTSKTGVKRIFGGNSDACVFGSIKDADGKNNTKVIYTWNLSKMMDSYGNNVIYKYINDSGYVYPDSIYYTGFNDKEGNYKIVFNYDEDIKREDIRIDARSGKIIYCKKLLTSITTHYGSGKFIRKYSFIYTEGLAKEKMLVSLKTENSENESYVYSFNYTQPKYDDGNIIYFERAKKWDNGKPLQLGKSTDAGMNFSSSAGVGFGYKVIDARVSGGGSGTVGSGESYTENTLVDMNGDGAPDSIRQDGKKLIVNLNLKDKKGFGKDANIRIIKGSFTSHLDFEKNKNSTIGWNVYTGLGLAKADIGDVASLGIGYSEVYQHSTSMTKCAFMDMNRDGLVDIVESGKSTYLKNIGQDINGDILFEEKELYSNVEVSDLTENIEAAKAEEYRKTYYVQTPFRMWKAPYEGIVSIEESAYGLKEVYIPEEKVVAKTYISDASQDDKDLRITVGTEPVVKHKVDIPLDKDNKVYFITDNGKEPKNSDIDWNIKINYSKLKAIKNYLQLPYVNLYKFEEIEFSDTETKKTEFTEEEKTAFINKVNESFINKKLDNKKVFFRLFKESINTSNIRMNQSTQYQLSVSIQFNKTWYEDLSDIELSEVIDKLVESGNVLPSVYTETQFEDYLALVKNKGNELEEEEKNQYFKNFANAFEYLPEENLFILINYCVSNNEYKNKDKQEKNFLEFSYFINQYPVPADILKNFLSIYKKYDLQPMFDTQKITYVNIYEENFNTFRDINLKGTILNDGNNIFVVVGKSEDNIVLLNLTDYSLNCMNKNQEIGKFNANLRIISNYNENDNLLKLIYGVNPDETGNYQSTLEIVLSDISYMANNLSEAEMKRVIDSFNVKYTDVNDEKWNLKDSQLENERIKDIDSIFNDLEYDLLDKETFINTLFVKKDVFANDNTYLYSYYVIKNTQMDLEKAQKILDEYKEKVVLQKLFPFYEKNKDYQLKDEWKKEISEENFESEWSKECRKKYCSKYEDYKKLYDFLLETNQKFSYGKAGSLKVRQELNQDYLYKLKNNTFTTFIFKKGFNYINSTYKMENITWNSAEDFSTVNKNIAKPINITISETVETPSYDNNDDEVLVTEVILHDLSISSNEVLYGGIKNWYYGIWQGSLSDVPFSEKKLFEYKEELNGILNNENSETSNEAFLKKQEETKNLELNKQKQESKIHFYIPQLQSYNEYVKDVQYLEDGFAKYTRKDSNYSQSVKLSESLLGNICSNSEVDEVLKKSVTRYYMPFINKDIIHVILSPLSRHFFPKITN